MLNIYFTIALSGLMSLGVLGAPVSFALYWSKLRGYVIDMSFALINGVMGVVGVSFYLLNIPVLGQVGTLDPFTAPRVLVWYVTVNVLRFFCWYAEFLTSFFLLMWMRNHVLLTLLRYAFHTLNLTFSVISFVLTIDVSFPARSLPGYNIAPPVVWQSLIVHYVVGSYCLIMSSRIYRVDNAVLWTTITSPCLPRRLPHLAF